MRYTVAESNGTKEIAVPKGLSPAEAAMFQSVQQLLRGTKDDLITGDEVSHHEDPARKDMVFPQDMTWGNAFTVLERKKREEEKITSFTHSFDFRFEDGLVAAAAVFKRMFGMTIGKTIRTFFGDNPPQMKTIKTSHNTSVQVPEGMVEIPSLTDTQIYLGQTRHRKFGIVFEINVEGPNKYKKIFDQMFHEIEKELAVNSIYRGKILSGARELEFVDLTGFDPRKLVFSAEVEDVLENGILSRIKETDLLKLEGVPIKTAALLHGPFGTGKSSLGAIIAQIAQAHGWTFIFAKAGVDKIEDVLGLANMYAPAVVFAEDLDIEANNGDPTHVSRMLDALDNATNKSSEIILVVTSNHIKKIHKGMLRPGRLDFTIEVGPLDRPGVERLFKVVVGESKIDKACDFDAIWDEMKGFEPAFVKATADRAKTWALNRSKSPNYVLTTEDLVGAARSLHAQQKLHEDAGEGSLAPTLDTAFNGVLAPMVAESVKNNITGAQLIDNRGSRTHIIHPQD